jgi:hypothetical protein
MLKSPMSASAQAATAGPAVFIPACPPCECPATSAMCAGRCVVMNATWNPQTKNPATSNR